MASTTYTVKVNGKDTESRSKKSKAVELAEQALAREPESTVEVVTNAGTVVWPEVEAPEAEAAEATPAATGTRTKPFTRTEDPNFEIEAPEGYEAAYTRARVSAVVFRKIGEKGDYRVLQVNADGEVIVDEPATNTTEAREITNRLAAEHKVAVAEAKEAEKAAKEKAKADKAAEKAAKLAEKEAEAAAAEQPEAELVEA